MSLLQLAGTPCIGRKTVDQDIRQSVRRRSGEEHGRLDLERLEGRSHGREREAHLDRLRKRRVAPALAVHDDDVLVAQRAQQGDGRWQEGLGIGDRRGRQVDQRDARVPAHVRVRHTGMEPRHGACQHVQAVRGRETAQADALDLQDIYVSTGSACHARKDRKNRVSHVLTAQGLTEEQSRSAVRFSLGSDVTAEDIDRVVSATCAAVDRLRRTAGRQAVLQ